MSGINLKELIENYPDCLNSASKLKGYLMDLYPDAGARLSIIATIYDCGIATEIKKAASMDELTLSAYVARLEYSYGYSPRLSKECLKLWGEVYGIAAPVDESCVLEESKKKEYNNPADFEIENGVLKKYNGPGGDITIPDSVTSIGDNAFSSCKSLTSVTIPNSVTEIGKSVFIGCSGLTSITISDNVKKIGWDVFAGCSSLTSIRIPANVTWISNWAFYRCNDLAHISVDKNNKTYDSRNNCNAIIESASNTLVVGCKNTIIPAGVKKIGVFAFAGCSSLKSIAIPDSVTELGGAFLECSGLKNITIPGGVTEIGERTFEGCNSLTSITIPDSVTNIGEGAFKDCSKLRSIMIPASVTSIGERTFEHCKHLTIYAHRGSHALRYAIEHHTRFSVPMLI